MFSSKEMILHRDSWDSRPPIIKAAIIEFGNQFFERLAPFENGGRVGDSLRDSFLALAH